MLPIFPGMSRTEETIVFLLLGSTALLTGCGTAEGTEPHPGEASTARPRPVALCNPEPTTSSRTVQLPGVVAAWVREDIAAEVSGKIVWITEEGTTVRGPDGDHSGDVIARIDPSTYEAAHRAALARRQRASVQLEKVAPARIRRAEAAAQQASWELERLARVRETNEGGAVSELQLQDMRAQAEVADADLAEARAARAEAEAQLAEAEAAVANAALDLERTIVRAPFPGEVAVVRLEVGGFAQPGTTLLHLVRLDPIRVDVALSQAMAREVAVDDEAMILVRRGQDGTTRLPARLYQLGTAADRDTRTFRASFLLRNDPARQAADSSDAPALPTIGGVVDVQPGLVSDPVPGLFVPARRSLRRDETTGRQYVWRVVRTKPGDTLAETRSYRAERVFVETGDRSFDLQGLIQMVEIRVGELGLGDVIALDPSSRIEDGGIVRASHTRWTLRPGDSVQVEWAPPSTEDDDDTRYLVPTTAVQLTTAEHGYVFAVDQGKAVRLPVRIEAARGETPGMQVIRAPEPETGSPLTLSPDIELISRGAHFLRDGDAVNVVRRNNATPR